MEADQDPLPFASYFFIAIFFAGLDEGRTNGHDIRGVVRREDDGSMIVTEVKGQAEQLGAARGDRIVAVSNDSGYQARVPEDGSMSQDAAIKMIMEAGRPFEMELDTSSRERPPTEVLDAGQAQNDAPRPKKKQRKKKSGTHAQGDGTAKAKRKPRRPLANISFGVDLGKLSVVFEGRLGYGNSSSGD